MSDVFFPIVGCGGARIATVRCDCLNAKDYPAGRALVLARDEQEIERILADARSGEPTGAEIARPIWVRFMPQQFTGKSYGLALALADKRARYRSKFATQDNRIFATGLIVEDGFGRVGQVDAFEEKLKAIVDDAMPGNIVILPQENVDAASVREQGLLDRLISLGVICRVIARLDELADLYASSEESSRIDAPADGTTDERQSVFSAATPASSRGGVEELALQHESGRGSALSPRGLAMSFVVMLLTGLTAFAAGNWFGGGSLVTSYAGETVSTEQGGGENLLQNPSFEQGEGQQPVGWITFSRGKHDHADYVRSGGIDGSLVLEHRSEKAFYVDTHQVLNVPKGYYAFSAWVSSEGDRKAHRMRAKGDEAVEIDIPITAPHSFQELSIHCIEVTEGRLAVGFYMDAFKTSSAAYDKVEVVESSRAADGSDCAEAGSTGDTSIKAFDGENLVENPSFERSHDQNPIGWGTFSRGKYDHADSVQPGGIDGSFALEHGGDEAFYVDTYQVLWVPNGYYAMSAWINTDSVDKVNRMYARGEHVIELDIPKTAAGGYQQLQIHCIKTSEKKVVVGFYTDTHQASVVSYDNVQLVQHDQRADGTRCAES